MSLPPPDTGIYGLPVPSPQRVAEFVALCRDKLGIEFASEEEATKAMTDVLQLYYVLGGHLRGKEGGAETPDGEEEASPPDAAKPEEI